MRSTMWLVLVGVLVGGATFGAPAAEADDRRGPKKHRAESRYDDRDHHGDRYFSSREVVLVREYYGPRYRHEKRSKHKYHRTGYLPRGWQKRMRPYPVYVEREVIVLPRGYHRGIIDGHAVVYNSRGLIVDVAVLF